MHCNMIGANRKTASRRSLQNPIKFFDQAAATAAAFRFRRQPNTPIMPRPSAKRGRAAGMGNLSTPKSVQKLQTALHAKAKAEAGYRFYALYDKISREDNRRIAGKTNTSASRGNGCVEKWNRLPGSEGPCLQKVASLFSSLLFTFEKSSKSLILHGNCPF